MINAFRPAPYIKHWQTTRWSMFLIIMLLSPLLMTGYVAMGRGVIIQTLLWLVFHLIFELVANAYYRKFTVLDGSSLVSAFFLALLLPQGLSVVMMIQVSFFSVIISKWLQGGLGFNYLNPAVIGFLYALWAWPLASVDQLPIAEQLWYGAEASTLSLGSINESTALIDQLFSWILLLGAFIVLSILSVVCWTVALLYIVGYALLSYFFNSEINTIADIVSLILEPRLLFFACFIAPNPSSLPAKLLGKALYGLSMGLLTALLMSSKLQILALPLAVVWVNAMAVIINYYTRGRSFAGVKLGGRLEVKNAEE